MTSANSNALSRANARLDQLPAFIRRWARSKAFGGRVKFAGTAGLDFEELSGERVVVNIRNVRRVQNHIQGVHAAAMALLAETATGFAVGMHLPDDKLPLIKSMKVEYLKRAQGGLRAIAQLSPEQVAELRSQEKGSLAVPVAVTDESGSEPIRCEMVWAWIPKKH